ncbi:MAG: hypothetical protein ACJAU0_001521 [Flavobacteriales bacterium]|jgi:hypothetical protein
MKELLLILCLLGAITVSRLQSKTPFKGKQVIEIA